MYTLGDFLIKVKNAYMTGKKNLSYPKSNTVLAISKILEKEGYVKSVKEQDATDGTHKVILIELSYKNKMPAITEINLVSKPSIHRYIKRMGLRRASAKHGVGIVSTSKGIMTNRDAQKIGVGGELICQIY